jgi:ABC-type multidrug transport system fused ATPase/permease subunit
VGSISLAHAFPTLETIANAKGAATKVYSIIEQHPNIDSSSDTGEKPALIYGKIQFQNVSFTYPSRPDIQVWHMSMVRQL